MHDTLFVLLDKKIKALDKLLELDDMLMGFLEKEDMDSVASLMEKKFLIINEIKGIDRRLHREKKKNKNFYEQQRDKFRYINRRLTKLKEKEEKLLSIAHEKMKKVETDLYIIEEIEKVRKKYKINQPKRNIFERIG